MTISIACAACRAPNEHGARFCRRCGTPLGQDVAPPLMAIACPTCGQPVTGSQKFCRGCGHPLAAVAPGSQGAARNEPATAPAAQATAEAPSAPSRTPPSEPPASATHRMPTRQPELPVRSSPKSAPPEIRRRKIWLWAVAGGLLAAAVTAGALVYMGKLTLPLVAQRLLQDYVPVHAPDIQVGDAWTYEHSDPNNRNPTIPLSRSTYRVTAMEGDRVTVTQEHPGSYRTIHVYAGQQNLIESRYIHADESTFLKTVCDPPQREYDFPLLPGKAWGSISSCKSSKPSGSADSIHEIPHRTTVTGKVLGWERNIGRLDTVEVDGLKLRIETIHEAIGDNGATTVHSTITSTEWYVPAAGRSVIVRQTLRMPKNSNEDQIAMSRLVNFIPN